MVENTLDMFMRRLAKWMALLGGAVLICLIAVTCISVIGRLLNTIGHYDILETEFPFISNLLIKFGPIVGDFEIIEAGIAFSIMAFLPWCQLNRAHAIVEIFTGFLPGILNRMLGFIWEALFAFVMIIIAWRLYVGTTDKMRFEETTFMLQFPVWWGYAACTFAAIIACIISIYSVWLHARDLKNSNPEISQTGERRV
ncbi:MAG: TRAP transporter small permease [Rhizobiaceae bacterium]